MRFGLRAAVALVAVSLLDVLACSGARREATPPPGMPTELGPSWSLFVRRCSKCHSLARPLDSGIDDDEHWRNYVERMRLTPGSGISKADAEEILQFLRFYAADQRRKKSGGGASTAAPPPPSTSPPPDGGPP